MTEYFFSHLLFFVFLFNNFVKATTTETSQVEGTVTCTHGVGHVICDGVVYSNSQQQTDNNTFWLDFGISFGLLVVAGTSFGLAFGFVSLDRLVMKVKYKNKKHPYAKGLAPIVKMHSQVLVTLLLTYVAALEAIPLFLSRLVTNPFSTLGISIPIVFFLGEIIPCSICVRWTLTVGYWLRPFIWFFVAILFPIAWPVAKILDAIHGPASYAISSRPALKELVQVYTSKSGEELEGQRDPFVAAAQATLSDDEVNIILGALNMKEKTVENAMTKLDEVFMLSDSQSIEPELVTKLIENGHSRVPVYHGNRGFVIGMILTTVLLGHILKLKPGQKANVDDLELIQLPCVSSSMSLYKILNQFKGGKSQMAVVLDSSDHVTPVGIITLDDVFSILVDCDLLDEFDMLQERRMWDQNTIIEEPDYTRRHTEPIAFTPYNQNYLNRSNSHPPPYQSPDNSDHMPASHSLQFPKNQRLRNLLLQSRSMASGGQGSTIFFQTNLGSISTPPKNKPQPSASENSHLLENEQMANGNKNPTIVLHYVDE